MMPYQSLHPNIISLHHIRNSLRLDDEEKLRESGAARQLKILTRQERGALINGNAMGCIGVLNVIAAVGGKVTNCSAYIHFAGAQSRFLMRAGAWLTPSNAISYITPTPESMILRRTADGPLERHMYKYQGDKGWERWDVNLSYQVHLTSMARVGGECGWVRDKLRDLLSQWCDSFILKIFVCLFITQIKARAALLLTCLCDPASPLALSLQLFPIYFYGHGLMLNGKLNRNCFSPAI